jgi:hypothetical protein
MKKYREWLPANSYEATGSIGGSFVSKNIEDYYVTPYEMGYGSFIKFDHDFIGSEALQKMAGKPHRRKVTFAWNPDDVVKVWRSMLEQGDPYKFIDLPLSNYTSASYDRIMLNGKQVGLNMFSGYSYNERSMLSLGIVDANVELGTEVKLAVGRGRRRHEEAHRRAPQAARDPRQGQPGAVRQDGADHVPRRLAQQGHVIRRDHAAFRADHVGSLLRPHELHDMREQVRMGKADAAKLKRGRGPPDPRRGEAAGGPRPAVDHRRRVPPRLVAHRLHRRLRRHRAAARGRLVPRRAVQGRRAKPPTMFVKRKLRRTKPSMVPHFRILKERRQQRSSESSPCPRPRCCTRRGDRESIKKIYPDQQEFWADLTKCYREEIADLYKAGCRYLQIDDTTIAMFGDPKVQETFRKLGDDPKKDVAFYAQAVNDAIRDVPDDMTVAIHTCRGNFRSTWLAKAATTTWPRPRSRPSTSTASSSSTTTSARAASSRCVTFRRASAWCWDS